MRIGGDFLSFWSFRLYLGASSCIYFLAHDVFILMFFLWDVYVRGRHYVFLSLLLFLVSHVIHWILIYIMRLFMIYVFYFLFCEIKNLFCFYLYFLHVFMCLLSITGIYRLIQSCCCLYWQLINSS